MLRTLKEDLVWTYDWDNPFAFAESLKQWIDDYNTDYPHQSLNNMTPKQYYDTLITAKQHSQSEEPILT